jgi:hypothetical protein
MVLPPRGPTVRGRGYTSAVSPGPDPGISWKRHGHGLCAGFQIVSLVTNQTESTQAQSNSFSFFRTVVNSLAGGCAGEGGEKKGTWLGGGLLPNSDENGQGGLTVLGPT